MSASLPRRPLAAVDLGSNSFRLLLAEIDQSSAGPQLRILDQIKESVRLGAGLDKHFDLSDEARHRALQALGRWRASGPWPPIPFGWHTTAAPS